VLRWRFLRFASLLPAIALLLGLTACGGPRIVPAQVVPPQSPSVGPTSPLPSPVAPVTAEPLGQASAAGPVKVGLLVPMSGPNTELGKAMLEAAQLALFTTGGDRLTLVPRDTGGTPEGAANAARQIIGEGAKLLLGPLLAAEVEAVKPIALEAKINVIAFSTATQLAGGNVFLMGFLPRQEVAREVALARDRGLTRFAALAPDTQYGRLVAGALRDVATASGGTVTKVEFLDPRAPDPAPAVQRLLSGGGAAAPPAFGPPASVPAANTSFDALLLPEGGVRLKQIAHQLRQAGLDTAQIRLLGSGLWDDPAIASEPALYGGWFAASPPEPRREFETRFQATYNHPPPRLASLAFDAAALAAVLARNGGPEPFAQEAILNPAGFTGVDGLFRFTQEGLVQRGLAVLEVQQQGTVVVSPAPASFRDFSS
jgi:ABC-type branched-subunit amino acid transport system substrate-binding protein